MIGYNESHDALSVTVGNVSGPSGLLYFKWSHQGRVPRRDPLVIPVLCCFASTCYSLGETENWEDSSFNVE